MVWLVVPPAGVDELQEIYIEQTTITKTCAGTKKKGMVKAYNEPWYVIQYDDMTSEDMLRDEVLKCVPETHQTVTVRCFYSINVDAFVSGLDIKMDEESYIIAVGHWNNGANIYSFKKADIGSPVTPKPIIWNFQQKDRVYDVALCDNGSIFVVGGRDKSVKLYDMTVLLEKNTLKEVKDDDAFAKLEDSDKVYSVAISSDGRHIAYGGVAKNLNVKLLGKHEKTFCIPKHVLTYPHKSIIQRIEFVGNTHVAAISEDGRCSIHSVDSKMTTLQLRVKGTGNSLSFSSSNLLAIAHGHSVSVYGNSFGYGPMDRPSINLAKSLMEDPESLEIALVAHPSLTNVFDNTRKCLLSFAVQNEKNVVVDMLLNSQETSGLILAPHKDETNKFDMFKSPLTIAIANKDRNMVEKILSAINSKKISHTEGLFLKGFFARYRKGPDLCNIGAATRRLSVPAEEGLGLKEHTQVSVDHTVFEDIAELCPAPLLKFLVTFQLDECDPEVLGGLENAVLESSVYVSHPFRSPVGFWKRYYEMAKDKNVEDAFKVTAPESLVEAMRIPIPGICGSGKVDSAAANIESFRPLGIILTASTSLKDFSVFGKNSIVHAMVQFHWTIIGPHFTSLLYQYIAYLGICVWQSWRISRAASQFLDFPFYLSIVLFIISSHFLLWEFKQFLIEFSCTHDKKGWKRFTSAFAVHFSDLWNVIDIFAFTAQIVTDIYVLFFPAHTIYFVSWAAVAILLLFLKGFFYARAFPVFGPFVRMIQRTMSGMRNFLLVMLIFVLGFALAFNVLLRDVDGFTNLQDAFLSTLLMIYGDYSVLENSPPDSQPYHFSLSSVLFNVMNLFCSVTMLNLLVAILSSSYEEIKVNSHQESVAQFASIIIETQKMNKKYRYRNEMLFRKWVHFLKPVQTLSIIEDTSEFAVLSNETNTILTEMKDEIQNLYG